MFIFSRIASLFSLSLTIILFFFGIPFLRCEPFLFMICFCLSFLITWDEANISLFCFSFYRLSRLNVSVLWQNIVSLSQRDGWIMKEASDDESRDGGNKAWREKSRQFGGRRIFHHKNLLLFLLLSFIIPPSFHFTCKFTQGERRKCSSISLKCQVPMIKERNDVMIK